MVSQHHDGRAFLLSLIGGTYVIFLHAFVIKARFTPFSLYPQCTLSGSAFEGNHLHTVDLET
jgi:hypothetical protein